MYTYSDDNSSYLDYSGLAAHLFQIVKPGGILFVFLDTKLEKELIIAGFQKLPDTQPLYRFLKGEVNETQ